MDEKNQANQLEPEQTVGLAGKFNEGLLENILKLEKKCFPEEWQYDNAEEYFKDALTDESCINILLKEGEKIVGYLFAAPLKNAYPTLKEHDPVLVDDHSYFYLDNIEIIPESRGRGGARKLIKMMCEEANRREFTNFSIHARTTNGLHEIIKKMFHDTIKGARRIDRWHFGGDEPYEYIEWTYNKQN